MPMPERVAGGGWSHRRRRRRTRRRRAAARAAAPRDRDAPPRAGTARARRAASPRAPAARRRSPRAIPSSGSRSNPSNVNSRLTVRVDVLHPCRHGEQVVQFGFEAESLEHPRDLGVEVAGARLRVRRRVAFVDHGAQAGLAAQVGERGAGGTQPDDGDVVLHAHSGASVSHWVVPHVTASSVVSLPGAAPCQCRSLAGHTTSVPGGQTHLAVGLGAHSRLARAPRTAADRRGAGARTRPRRP